VNSEKITVNSEKITAKSEQIALSKVKGLKARWGISKKSQKHKYFFSTKNAIFIFQAKFLFLFFFNAMKNEINL
jgi:hypothetical protein